MAQKDDMPNEASFYARTGRYRWAIAEWMMSTDHKRIGVMYLAALLSFFSVGVVLGFLIRLSLLSPGWLMDAQTYNEFFTIHGVIQIFLFIIPGIPVAFGNIFLPILIGAQDVAFPKINRLSWWLYVTGALIVMLSLFIKELRPIRDGPSMPPTASGPRPTSRLPSWASLSWDSHRSSPA